MYFLGKEKGVQSLGFHSDFNESFGDFTVRLAIRFLDKNFRFRIFGRFCERFTEFHSESWDLPNFKMEDNR